MGGAERVESETQRKRAGVIEGNGLGPTVGSTPPRTRAHGSIPGAFILLLTSVEERRLRMAGFAVQSFKYLKKLATLGLQLTSIWGVYGRNIKTSIGLLGALEALQRLSSNLWGAWRQRHR